MGIASTDRLNGRNNGNIQCNTTLTDWIEERMSIFINSIWSSILFPTVILRT